MATTHMKTYAYIIQKFACMMYGQGNVHIKNHQGQITVSERAESSPFIALIIS